MLLAVVGIYLSLETLFPLYRVKRQLPRRWLTNGLLYSGNVLFLYWFFHSATLDVLEIERPMEAVLALPLWAQFIIFLLFFDLFQYVVHVLSHRFDFLWRIHVTHHADEDIDSTTSFRHHPFEFCLECTMRLVALWVTGVSIEALILYDIVLTCHTFFAHSNIKVPVWFDLKMRKLFITPDFHRVHHSIERHQADNNYGFLLTIWDQVFRTDLYIPQEDQTKLDLGVSYIRGPEEVGFFRTLLQPFTCFSNSRVAP